MDDNNLLMIILAFVVGFMLQGMMNNMCGVRLIEGKRRSTPAPKTTTPTATTTTVPTATTTVPTATTTTVPTATTTPPTPTDFLVGVSNLKTLWGDYVDSNY